MLEVYPSMYTRRSPTKLAAFTASVKSMHFLTIYWRWQRALCSVNKCESSVRMVQAGSQPMYQDRS
ncbi:hypothetical protein, partial [Streptococcus suis]|uniref:hypothetical protein n=1 Tax=Streptococcus suis TaxID=1307 RepID=UPI00370D8EDD